VEPRRGQEIRRLVRVGADLRSSLLSSADACASFEPVMTAFHFRDELVEHDAETARLRADRFQTSYMDDDHRTDAFRGNLVRGLGPLSGPPILEPLSTGTLDGP
jgi:hypothetical protein